MIYKILGAKRQFIDFTNEVDDYLKSLDQVLESPEIQLDSPCSFTIHLPADLVCTL